MRAHAGVNGSTLDAVDGSAVDSDVDRGRSHAADSDIFPRSPPIDQPRPSPRSIDEIDQAILRLSRRMNADNYQLLVLVREFDERGGWRPWGFDSCALWLHWRCDMSYSAARERVRVAHALKVLPAMSAAFSTGSLSYSKVRALTRIADAGNEAGLIAMAMDMSATHVDEHCRQRQYARPESRKQAESALASRSLRVWHDTRRGVVSISIDVPIEDGLLFERAIDKACADGEGSRRAPDDATPWSALQADTVVAMARAYLAGDAATPANDSPSTSAGSTSTADHYQVMIHVDHAALVGTGGGASDGEANGADAATAASDLPIDIVKRLCCDGSIVPIVESGDGEPIAVGRRQRVVGTAVRRALWARDRGCVFPGCSHTRFVDAHHVRHWANGGETRIDNLVLLCSMHHRLVHEGGFEIRCDHQGRQVFRRPDGRIVPRCGYRIEDWGDEYPDGDSSIVEGGRNDPQESFRQQDTDLDRFRVREPTAAYRSCCHPRRTDRPIRTAGSFGSVTRPTGMRALNPHALPKELPAARAQAAGTR